MSLLMATEVLSNCGDLFSLLIYLLAHLQQCLPSETWYLHLLLLFAHLTCEAGIVFIFKHAATLCLSGVSAEFRDDHG
jgi:hypothetical protein